MYEGVSKNMNDEFDDILSAIFQRRLTHNILDSDALTKLTSHTFFRDTIYLINPLKLYEFGQLDLVSYNDGIVVFMLSFPVIKRQYSYKKVDIVESPRRLLLSKNDYRKFHSFIIPVDVPLHNVSMSDLRSSNNCIKTKSFDACDGNSAIPYEDKLCIGAILNNVDSDCYHKSTYVFDFNVEYSKQNALIFLKNGSKIIDMNINKVIHKADLNTEKCVVMKKRNNLFVQSQYRRVRLFPPNVMVSTVKSVDLTYVHKIVVKNLTLPVYNVTRGYIPVVFDSVVEDTDILEIVAIAGVSIVFLIFLILFIRKFARLRRNGVVNGNDLFPPAQAQE